MQYNRQRYRKRPSAGNYIIPFLIIVALGVIIVLVINLWQALFSQENPQGAYMHVVDGSVQLKTWGTDDFFSLSTDALILQGDEIQTSADAMVIMEFFDGTIMRIDGGTGLVFDEVNGEGKTPSISILFVDGRIWFNKLYKETGGTAVEIKMAHVVVKVDGTSIFAVDNDFEEVVRVLHGDEVIVEVLSDGDNKVVDEETIGVGQEIVFSESVLQKYWQFQSPTVLAALSDDFKDSDWYAWNLAEDEKPTQFVKTASSDGGFFEVVPEVVGDGDVVGDETVEGEVVDGEIVEPEQVEGEAVVDETKPEEVVDSGALAKPTIFSVAGVTSVNADGFYVVTSRVATLTGEVSGASGVVVNGYTLTKFNSGDSSWSYFANADFGLMTPGENTYEVYAVDENGAKSGTLTVKVLYNPPAGTVLPEAAPAEVPVTEEPAPIEEEIAPPDWLTTTTS